MRSLIVQLLFLMFFSSCAHQAHRQMGGDAQSTLFAGESLLRVGGNEKPDSCYREEVAQFTQKARERFAAGGANAAYWNGVGNCLAWHGEVREARFFLGLALSLAKGKEEDAMVRNNLAVLSLRQGRVSRAFELLSEAREKAPRFIAPAFNLAQLYVSQGMNTEALKILQAPPFAAATDGEVLHLRALALLQGGQTKEAGALIQRLPAGLASRPDVALTMAQWHVREARPEEAMSLLENLRAPTPALGVLGERLKTDARAQIAAKEAK